MHEGSDTITLGNLEITNISGTHNGTLKGNDTEVTTSTIFGSCVYGFAKSLDLGTIVAGSPATLSINAITPKISGNATCPAEARWTASYAFTTPSTLTVTP